MPIAHINGVEINYEIIGEDGPWVVVIQGGRISLSKMAGLVQAMAARGYRVIVHDRRNCGRSSIDFHRGESEDDVWVDDLHALLKNLKVAKAFVVGRSGGARMAIHFALRYPEATHGLGLWGPTGGAVNARYLNNYYYGQYQRACESGGMAAVCALGHFADLVKARPENRDVLLATDPLHFVSTMNRWSANFLTKSDRPVIGFSDSELSSVGVPTAVLPFYDRSHPYESARHAHTMISGSRLFDYDPARRHDPTTTAADDVIDMVKVAAILCDFESSLPRRRAAGIFLGLKRRLLSWTNP